MTRTCGKGGTVFGRGERGYVIRGKGGVVDASTVYIVRVRREKRRFKSYRENGRRPGGGKNRRRMGWVGGGQ